MPFFCNFAFGNRQKMTKKAEKTNDGKRGGLLGGKRHAQGGVKAVVVDDNNRPVELESGEVIINRKAVKKHHALLSRINQETGGRPIYKPSSVGVMAGGGQIKKQKSSNENITKIISRTGKIKHADFIKSAINYLSNRKKSGARNKSEKQGKKEKELVLISQFPVVESFKQRLLKNKIGAGSEQIVCEHNGIVYKFNSGVFYSDWKQYLTSILIHNYFFPATSYELIGFCFIKVENKDVFCSLVSQPFVLTNEETNIDSVKLFMEKSGFANTKNNDYFNEEFGLILEDLHDENVLTKNGVLFFIDTVFYIKEGSK